MYNLFNLPEKKFKIYMAAANVFGRKGFYKTTIEDIAQEADIGKSTVYEYVESKEKLFSEIVSSGFEFFMDNLTATLHDVQGIEAKIRSFIKAWLLLIKDHYNLYKVVLCDYYDPCHDQNKNELFWALKTRIEELLSDALKESIQAGQLRNVHISLITISLVGILMGVSSSFDRDDKENIDIEKLSNELSAILLNGIMIQR